MYKLFLFILLYICTLVAHGSIYAATNNTLPSSTGVFHELGIELKEEIADTYFVGDSILIHGGVTNGTSHALIYLKNIKSGESLSKLADVDAHGDFYMPLSFPTVQGEYWLIVASGNSFKTTLHKSITLVSNKIISRPTSPRIFQPNIVYTPSPYLFFGNDVWAYMTIEQGNKIYKAQGKILSLDNMGLSYGKAKISIQGYSLSGPSSLSRISSGGFVWSGSIFMDRKRDIIGKDLVTFRLLRSTATMQFRVKKGTLVSSKYYVTSPSGDVATHYFPQQYLDSQGFLLPGILIRQSFMIPDPGVYKIETVQNNGYAYFNLPISRQPFWGIIPSLSDAQETTLRQDLSAVTLSILESINTLRTSLGKSPLSIDPILADLAQKKANDMANYDYVGHITHDGLDILQFAHSQHINIAHSIGENVAGGNVSDVSLQDGLKESGGHRSNMLDPDWKHMGIGYVLKGENTYLVEIFGE